MSGKFAVNSNPEALNHDLRKLDDYSGSIDDLITALVAVRNVHGGRHVIKFDAGYNNVSCLVTKYHHSPSRSSKKSA